MAIVPAVNLEISGERKKVQYNAKRKSITTELLATTLPGTMFNILIPHTTALTFYSNPNPNP